MTSMHDRDRRGAGVVVLFQFGDDQQRRDLRLHRQVAGDEDDRSVFAQGARKRQGEAGQQRGRTSGKITRVKTCQRLAPRLDAASSSS